MKGTAIYLMCSCAPPKEPDALSDKPTSNSRRHFLKSTLVGISSVAVSSQLPVLGNPRPDVNECFLNESERPFLDAAVDRLIPPDDSRCRYGPTGYPYGPGILVGDTIYVLGLQGKDRQKSQVAARVRPGSKKLLGQCGNGFDMGYGDVVWVQIYLVDISQFQQVNDIYKTYFLTLCRREQPYKLPDYLSDRTSSLQQLQRSRKIISMLRLPNQHVHLYLSNSQAHA